MRAGVGIPGSGLMGGKLGTIFARAGHEVTSSYARSKDKLNKLASGAQGNARAGTPTEAAKDADALLLAGDPSGKVIARCSSHNRPTREKGPRTQSVRAI